MMDFTIEIHIILVMVIPIYITKQQRHYFSFLVVMSKYNIAMEAHILNIMNDHVIQTRTSCATANSQSEMEQYECDALYVATCTRIYQRELLYGTNKKRIHVRKI